MKYLLILFAGLLAHQAQAQDAAAAVKKLEGVYAGEWTMYRLGDKAQPMPAGSWKDTLTSKEVTITKAEAAVAINIAMRFDNPRIPAMKFNSREGYTLDAKGKPQAYFIEMNGQRVIAQEVGPNTYAYTSKPDAQELGRLGLGQAKDAWHTTVKAVVLVQGVETHKITRLTTAVLADGSIQQFVSLSGFHTKIK